VGPRPSGQVALRRIFWTINTTDGTVCIREKIERDTASDTRRNGTRTSSKRDVVAVGAKIEVKSCFGGTLPKYDPLVRSTPIQRLRHLPSHVRFTLNINSLAKYPPLRREVHSPMPPWSLFRWIFFASFLLEVWASRACRPRKIRTTNGDSCPRPFRHRGREVSRVREKSRVLMGVGEGAQGKRRVARNVLRTSIAVFLNST
jgi:hypothetical protein